GNLVAFYEHDPDAGDFSVVVIGPGTSRRVLSRGWRGISESLAWSRDGNEVWFSATQLGGDRILRADDLSGHERVVGQVPGQIQLEDIARDGRLLFAVANTRMALSYSGPEAKAERELSWLDSSWIYDISAD